MTSDWTTIYFVVITKFEKREEIETLELMSKIFLKVSSDLMVEIFQKL